MTTEAEMGRRLLAWLEAEARRAALDEAIRAVANMDDMHPLALGNGENGDIGVSVKGVIAALQALRDGSQSFTIVGEANTPEEAMAVQDAVEALRDGGSGGSAYDAGPSTWLEVNESPR